MDLSTWILIVLAVMVGLAVDRIVRRLVAPLGRTVQRRE